MTWIIAQLREMGLCTISERKTNITQPMGIHSQNKHKYGNIFRRFKYTIS